MFDFNYYAELEPQKYYENKDDTPTATAKREAMLGNKQALYVASEKHDGEWSMSIIDTNNLLVRSRSRGVNGSFGNFTDKIPHITQELKLFPVGTVILGELCYLDYSKTSKDVGSILRCLTPKAIARQSEEKNKLHLVIFDCLSYGGESLMGWGYLERLHYISDRFDYMRHPREFSYIQVTNWVTSPTSFEDFVMNIWAQGGEGAVIQRIDAKYTPGARPSWQSLKVKKHMDPLELPVIYWNGATKEYTGVDSANWPYKDKDGKPVTKYWYNGWAGGITVNYFGNPVAVSSGLTDEDREWLTTEEAGQLIAQGKLYAVISAMEVTDKHSLRHPILEKLRTDEK
jgi:ATP-dependent DNA ligase